MHVNVSCHLVSYLCVIIDFPQVHTVSRFIAREPDELDLEEADVVSVYQKSPDGRCLVLFIVIT